MIDLDLREVRQLCEAGLGARAAHRLRWGISGDGLRCRPFPTAAVAALTWSRLRRLPPDSRESRAATEAALSTLWSAGQAIAICVAAASEGPAEVFVGVAPAGGADAWLRSLLGPGVELITQEGPPPGLGWLARPGDGRLRRAVMLRLAPPAVANGRVVPAAGESVEDGPPLAVLARLLLVPGRPFAALVVAAPLSRKVLEEARLDGEAALDVARRRVTTTEQVTESTSVTISDPAMERAAAGLDLLLGQLHRARVNGGWAVELVVAGAVEADVASLVSAVATGFPAPARPGGDRLADELSIDPAAPGSGASFLSTDELVGAFAAPPASIATLEVLEAPPGGRLYLPAERPLDLGYALGGEAPFVLDVADAGAHVFVAGITGSGKSTTLWRLLSQLANRHDIAFLIVDPVKREHEGLAGVLRAPLQVVRTDDLRLSALEPLPGFDRATHLGLVANAFRGCFALPTPVPYVVRLLFDRLLATPGRPLTLHDLRAELDPLVDQLGYRGEADANIRAALGARLALLAEPRRAARLCAPDQSQLEALLRQPTLVELADCGDDDERSFYMALLTIYIAESARLRGSTPQVRHVTVLEEAHRILPEPRGQNLGGDVEGGDSASAVARLLTQLLAEMRSFGESVVVVDQSPAAVAREVVRNTGLKIVHRTVDPSDREVVGGALGLAPDRCGPLAHLAAGEAIVAGQRIRSPQTVRITRVQGRPREGSAPELGSGRWLCCPGGPPHHRAEAAGEEAELTVALLCAATLNGHLPRRDRLAVLAAAQGLEGSRCLAFVGLRRYLRRLVELGQLDPAGLQATLSQGYADHVAHGGFAEVARLVGPEVRAVVAPWRGCSRCDSRCTVRAVRGAGLRHRTDRLRELLSRAAPGQERTVVVPWATQLQGDFADDLGPTARDLALCSVLAAAASLGLGDRAEPLLSGGDES